MRKPLDRLRHAISFEILALLIIIPLGAAVFHTETSDMAVIGTASAMIATLWNFLYNYLFDRVMQRRLGTTLKTARLRILHSVLFEAGLLIALMPLIAWYLQIGLLQALVMDLSFALFYLVYAFCFNWGYDRLFPLAEWSTATAQGAKGG